MSNHEYYGMTSTGSSVRQQRNAEKIAIDLLTLLGTSARLAAPTQTEQTVSSISSTHDSFLSHIEIAILRADNPIDVTTTEELTVLGQRGIWMNKSEVESWRGDISISEYAIHEDSNPQVLTKKVKRSIEYVQELAIRYLRPPTPPTPGEIFITQNPNIPTRPAPPLIIRQVPARIPTPEPLIIREAPPKPPVSIGPKRITISGKRIPPPPRKVVIERLAPIPTKPQNVIIERWLPYAEQRRRVIFNKPTQADPVPMPPRNVIIQWESPDVTVTKNIKYMGAVQADPVEYVKMYGSQLRVSDDLPQFVKDIPTPEEIGTLAADYKTRSLVELEGQLEGFKLVNLDNEGLSAYRSYLLAKGIRDLGALSSASAVTSSPASTVIHVAVPDRSSPTSWAAQQIFDMIDIDRNGFISLDEAEKIVLKLNSKFRRAYGEVEVKHFFDEFSHGQGTITRQQFLHVFEKL